MSNLHNQIALITGASRGIGRACALELARLGAKVAVNFLHHQEQAESVVSEIKKSGGEAVAIQADVSKKAECEELIKQTLRHFGKIDILINNAGTHGERSIDQLDEELWDRLMDTNLKSVYRLSVLVGQEMKKQGQGVIVNLSSIAAYFPRPTNVIYATSKGAIETLTRGLAVALAPEVRVNCVAPGRIETDMAPMNDPDKRQKVIASNLRGRIGQPADIARVVKFLVSDDADWINGQVIWANGGSSVLAKL